MFQTVKRNVGVIAHEDRKLFRIVGKVERAAIDVIFVGNVIREVICIFGCGKHSTQHGPFEAHVIMRVFHIDYSMFIGDSTTDNLVTRANT